MHNNARKSSWFLQLKIANLQYTALLLRTILKFCIVNLSTKVILLSLNADAANIGDILWMWSLNLGIGF